MPLSLFCSIWRKVNTFGQWVSASPWTDWCACRNWRCSEFWNVVVAEEAGEVVEAAIVLFLSFMKGVLKTPSRDGVLFFLLYFFLTKKWQKIKDKRVFDFAQDLRQFFRPTHTDTLRSWIFHSFFSKKLKSLRCIMRCNERRSIAPDSFYNWQWTKLSRNKAREDYYTSGDSPLVIYNINVVRNLLPKLPQCR